MTTTVQEPKVHSAKICSHSWFPKTAESPQHRVLVSSMSKQLLKFACHLSKNRKTTNNNAPKPDVSTSDKSR